MSTPNRSNRKADRTQAVTLDVPSGVADDIEAVLRGFAEEAELDTSLVVDHSGYLIAGISSLPEVDVDTIGACVAEASHSADELTSELGENGSIESIHLGEDRILYMKDVGERFILVGVSDAGVPAGILRDQAAQIEKPLLKFLARVKAVPMSLTKKRPFEEKLPEPEPPKSLRPQFLGNQLEAAQENPADHSAPNPAPRPVPPAQVAAAEQASAPPAEQPAASPAAQPVPNPAPEPAQPTAPEPEEPAAQPAPKPTARPIISKVTTRAVTGGRVPLNNQPPVNQSEPQPDPMPDSLFEVDDSEQRPAADPFASDNQKDDATPIETKRVAPKAIVENSPFEMDSDDDDDDDESSRFKAVRPNTTPVHISVPAARKRAAEARKEEDDDDQQSGPRYSFELG